MRLTSSLSRMLVFGLVPVVWIAACAPAPVENGLVPVTREAAPRYVVTSSEIEATGLSSAFDALRRLRPEMLTRRVNVVAPDPYDGLPVVYVDRVLIGKLELLSTVPAGVVREIRYYSPVAAKHEVGAFHPGGVIAVVTRK